ncbi:MAG: PEP-CTERM sorting domain-containing protein [bacterium]|nr:PEP-CTERM sorting domain-containing protein [bacterium]
MKNMLLLGSLVMTVMLWVLPACAVQSFPIVNASFESPTNVNDSIGFTNITGWTRSNNRSGLNPTASGWGAYADTGKRPDKCQVAFLNTEDGTLDISQPLTGLDTSKQYNLQFWHNARYWTNEINTNVCYFGVFFGEQVLAQITNSALDNWSEFYYFTNLVFTPAASEGALYFRNYLIASNVFSSLALDAVCLFQNSRPNALVVANPSFEASGEQGPGGFNTGIINENYDFTIPLWDFLAGWDYWDGGYNNSKFGVGRNGNPYFTSSLVPEGLNAFFDNKAEQYYVNSAYQTKLRQTIYGFNVGTEYELSYRYNGRPASEWAPGLWVRPCSNFTVAVGGSIVQQQDLLEYAPQFYATTVTFVADWPYMDLVFGTSNSPQNSATMCIDDVEISLVPEPAAATLLGVGLLALRGGRRMKR